MSEGNALQQAEQLVMKVDDASAQSSESEEDAPVVVAKPRTPFFQFSFEQRELVKDLPLGERGKRLGVLWAELPAEEKARFKELYQQQLAQYKEQTKGLEKQRAPQKQDLPVGYNLFCYSAQAAYAKQFGESVACFATTRAAMRSLWEKLPDEEKQAWEDGFAALSETDQDSIKEETSKFAE